MKEYIITVAVAAICAALSDILAPNEWSKYIRVMIGFLILSVIIAPVAKFKDVEIFSDTGTYNISDEPLKNKISETLKENIEKDIEDRISDEFGIEAKARVKLLFDENNNVKDVQAIEIKTWKNPDGMIERLQNVYGCEAIELKFE